MPPKAKFSREEVVKVALHIVETQGFEALTARNLGQKLGCSSRPIFTAFKNMDEVVQETSFAAKQLFEEYISSGLKETPPFKGSGKAYIRFAKEKPRLFQFLFMKEGSVIPDISLILNESEEFEKVLESITSVHKVSVNVAEKLYRHMWVYSHGIAVLIATKVCSFSDEQISQMLTEIFLGLLNELKK